MKRSAQWLFLLIPTVVLGFTGGFIATDFTRANNVPRIVNLLTEPFIAPEADQPAFSHGVAGTTVYDTAYANVGEIVSTTSDAAIVAHHLLAAADIARVFQTIGREDARTVVLISPNHFSIGTSPAQVSFGTWSTPYGEVASDIRAVRKLLHDAPVLKNEERVFQREHGIAAITPFVKRSFPNAQIVAIAVHESLTPDDARSLGDAIAEALPDAVIVASIDMSHYLPSSVAKYHDEITLRAIESGALEDNTELEIDSNAALRVLQAANRRRGETDWNLLTHNDSMTHDLSTPTSDVEGVIHIDVGRRSWRDNTSHILGYFTKSTQKPPKSDVKQTKSNVSQSKNDQFAAVHFVGDIMLDRDVRRLMEKNGVAAPWRDVERFLAGSHLTVGNLEGTVNERPPKYTYRPPFEFNFTPASISELATHVDLVSLANNHSQDVGPAGEMETRNRLDELGLAWFGSFLSPVYIADRDINGIPLTFIGYHAFRPDERTLFDEIRAADQNGRTVIVMPHWGVEYETQTESQRRLAENMIAAGADLIIGGHPHVIQGIEIMNGVPVIYSLGNFIFDQRFGETVVGLTAGVIFETNGINIHLLPVATNNGQPSPLSETETRNILEKIASQSPQSLRDHIRSGVISTTYE